MKRKLNPQLITGTAMSGLFIVWALLWSVYSRLIKGSFTRPYTPESDMARELIPFFSSDAWFGTDIYGRSLFEVISAGLTYSLFISLMVSGACVLIGIFVGYVCAKYRGLASKFLDYCTNIIFIFPNILIAILVMSIIGRSVGGLILIMIITGWPAYARICRGEIMRVLALSYVESAKAIGISESRLMLKVIIPNILPQVMVHFVLGLGGVIITESVLGLLGLGASEYSWGELLSMSKDVLLEAPALSVVMTTVLATLIIGLNLLGDGLRDFLDPYQQR